jgi:hypothetical protein
MQLSNDWPSRLARSLFTVMMALAWCGFVDAARARAPEGAAATQPVDSRAIADELERRLAILQQMRDELPKPLLDASDVVTSMGKDKPTPQALFEWVRDQTYWVPYRGVLRGEPGVLLDRQGNSADRSILLYGLLRACKHEARLARAKLSDDQATALLRRIRPFPVTPPNDARSVAAAAPDINAIAQRLEVDAVDLRAQLDGLSLRGQRLAEDLAQRIGQQLPALEAACAKLSDSAGHAPPASAPTSPVEAIREHWWVQYRDGQSWIDLDPTASDAAPGQAQAAPESTLQPQKLSELPEADLHLVQIGVVVEYLKRGELREVSVLQQKLLPGGLYGQPMRLYHVPIGTAHQLNALDPALNADTMKEAAAAEHEWMPVLEVGTTRVQRYSFTSDGMLNDSTLPTFAQAALAGRKLVSGMERGSETAGSRVGRMLGGGRGMGGMGAARNDAATQPATAPASPGDDQLTAEWIEFRILSPGRAERTVRRTIFDLLGPANRVARHLSDLQFDKGRKIDRGLALIGQTEILCTPCQLPREYVSRLMADSLVSNQAALSGLLRATGDSTLTQEKANEKTNELLSQLSPPPGPLYHLASSRGAFGALAAGKLFFDQPNIFARHMNVASDDAGNLFARDAIDIVANDLAARATDPSGASKARFEQGVWDTNLESAVQTTVLSDNNGGGVRRAANAADLYALSAAQQVEWITIRSASDSGALQRLQIPDDARARLEQDLAAGHAVMAPLKPILRDGAPRYAWWRMDPGRGAILGVCETGEGGTAVEYNTKIWVSFGIAVAAAALQFYGCGGWGQGWGRGVSRAKIGLCLACALLAGVFAYFVFVNLFGAFAQIEAATVAAMNGTRAGAAGVGVGMLCNIVSGAMH